MKSYKLLVLFLWTLVISGTTLPAEDQQLTNAARAAVFTRGLEKRLNALGEKLNSIQANLRCPKKSEKAEYEDCLKGKKKIDALAKLDELTDEFFESGNFALVGRAQVLLTDITNELEALVQACLKLPEMSLSEKSRKFRDFKAQQKIFKCRMIATLALDALDAVDAIAQFVSSQTKSSRDSSGFLIGKRKAALQNKINRVKKVAAQADEMIRYENACAQGKRKACQKVLSYNK